MTRNHNAYANHAVSSRTSMKNIYGLSSFYRIDVSKLPKIDLSSFFQNQFAGHTYELRNNNDKRERIMKYEEEREKSILRIAPLFPRYQCSNNVGTTRNFQQAYAPLYTFLHNQTQRAA